MRSLTSTAAFLVVPLLACAESRPPAAPTAPATSPAATVAPAEANEAPLEGGDIAGVPGWLAFSAKPDGDLPWDSMKSSARVFRIERDVKLADAEVAALTLEGAAPLQRRGEETSLYGCDGGTTVALTTFDGSVAPGMVWIVPAGTKGRELELVKSSSGDKRVWTLGSHTVSLEKTGVYTAVMRSGDRRVADFDVSKDLMDGYDAEPLDLDSPFLLPQAAAAWQVSGRTLLGLYWYSFEGTHLEVLELETGERHSLHYLYRCAF